MSLSTNNESLSSLKLNQRQTQGIIKMLKGELKKDEESDKQAELAKNLSPKGKVKIKPKSKKQLAYLDQVKSDLKKFEAELKEIKKAIKNHKDNK